VALLPARGGPATPFNRPDALMAIRRPTLVVARHGVRDNQLAGPPQGPGPTPFPRPRR